MARSVRPRALSPAALVVAGAVLVVLAGSAAVQLLDGLAARAGAGAAATGALFGAAAGLRARPALADVLLALGALSVFGWVSALVLAVPAVRDWLDTISVAAQFAVVNATKLSSVAVLALVAWRRGWSRRAWLIQVGDPRAPTGIAGVRWTLAAPVVAVAVAVLFLTDPSVGAGSGSVGQLVPLLALLLLGPLVNAVCEELLYRHAVVGTTRELVGVPAALLSSSAVFGVAHITGSPGGLTGVGFTFVYGLVSALAMWQTRGAVWNVAIHVVADCAAVTALVLAATA